MLLSFISNFLIILFFFSSLTSLGFIVNNKFFKLNTLNFFENFITGIFVLLFYLEFHLFFFKIDFYYTIHIFIILTVSLIYCINKFKFNKELTIILLLLILLLLNSDRYPYYNYIYDFGYYHNGYVNWLNQSNLVIGLANLHPSYGYTGNSFLLGSFFNVYPIFETGYVFTTSIFFLFFIVFLFYEIKKKISLFSKFFLIFSSYVILKYIFEEPLGDYSPYKINLILYLYVFYKLIGFLVSKNNSINDFYFIILTLSILVSFSPLSWSFSGIVVIFLFAKYSKFFFSKISVICIFYICIFYLINLLKSGHLLYPLQINFITTDYALSYDFLYHIKNFPKKYLPGLEWVIPWFKSRFITNSFCLLYSLSLFLSIILINFKKIYKDQNFLNFLYLLIIINILIIFWFFNSPDIKTGKIMFWTGIVLISSFIYSIIASKIENIYNKFISFINIKTSMFIFFLFVSFVSSLDNLILLKETVDRKDIINNFPSKKIIRLNDKNLIELKNLNYSNDKFITTHEYFDLENLKYEDGFFKKIFF